ncbi:phytoene/squalene synthase family protein [Parafrigoribacterium soli]|uniref:phytoene/squalene synthase family protein n=1 Tax=Parafrigoribacterium soli TaxID=3144663 RepID=UPI0032EE8A41
MRDSSRSELSLYSRAAHKSSATIIHEYSTSFGAASGLLHRSMRPAIENIYGLVRIADEVVDGAAAQAGLGTSAQLALLDKLERETNAAIATGYSTNVIVHSFAETARAVGIGGALTAPFFASMRRDLDPAPFTEEQVREYIYGSAEVVGLMCLRVFLHDADCSLQQRTQLEHGAQRLGAAFQKINFVRDLSVDWERLHRNYFPALDPTTLTEAEKLTLLDDIYDDLEAAGRVIPQLPAGCRTAVAAAHGLFAELTDRIRKTPAPELLTTRVRVPGVVKLRIVLAARAHHRVETS